MEFRILGPLEVRGDDGPLTVAGRKPRALLAMLLLHANEVVGAEQLVDAIWGMDAPTAAGATLRLNISRLRKALQTDVLVTKSPGYVLCLRPDELDLDRFERLMDDGRSLLARGGAGEASARVREALALWRGRPLADFADEDFAQPAIARLEEIRLAAVELRIDIDLALGRHADLVAQLRALVAEHPLCEHFWGCLMTALYRTGRQAEALGAYQDARRVLVDELGIEPSQELRELERGILRQDRELDIRPQARLTVREDRERSILVALSDENHTPALLAVAEPLARRPPRDLILATTVADATALREVSARLDLHRTELQQRGVVARAASFTRSSPSICRTRKARRALQLACRSLLTNKPEWAQGLLLTGLQIRNRSGDPTRTGPFRLGIPDRLDVAPLGAVVQRRVESFRFWLSFKGGREVFGDFDDPRLGVNFEVNLHGVAG